MFSSAHRLGTGKYKVFPSGSFAEKGVLIARLKEEIPGGSNAASVGTGRTGKGPGGHTICRVKGARIVVIQGSTVDPAVLDPVHTCIGLANAPCKYAAREYE